MTDNKNLSGKTFIKNEKIIWSYNGKTIVDIPINEIKIIGEYTTADGPFADDWFLVIYDHKSECFQISMYAENMQEMMRELGEIMQFELVGTLFASIDWESNILYPTKLHGQTLWNIVKMQPKSFFEKLMSFIRIYKKGIELTEFAQEAINNSLYNGFLKN